PTQDPSGNPGSLTATGSGLFIIGQLPNGGEPITIAENSTLVLETADSGTVTFAGADGFFVETAPSSFTGTVAASGGTFAPGDIINLQALGATSNDQFHITAAPSATNPNNTTLTVTDEANFNSASVT